MWIAAAELLCWALIGLALGFIGHWWKANADPYPDILDKDSPALNIALTEYSAADYALDHRYTDAGYWDYDSLRNLFYFLMTGVGGTVFAIYVSAEGHAAARGVLCSAASFIKFAPVFCP
jgi:hypothetical protein